MERNFDNIDIFFIISISIYFIILFLFIGTFLLNYIDLYSNKKYLKNVGEKSKSQPIKKKNTNYKSNISYVKNNPKKKRK